jgi:hypothetical protein
MIDNIVNSITLGEEVIKWAMTKLLRMK